MKKFYLIQNKSLNNKIFTYIYLNLFTLDIINRTQLYECQIVQSRFCKLFPIKSSKCDDRLVIINY